MHIHTNQRRVKLGRFLATSASVTGILMLLTATIAPFILPIAPPLGLAILAILIALVGVHNGNRWLRDPTPHDALNNGLKGLGKSAHLYHYYFPVPHVLICPYGVFSLTAQYQIVAATVEHDQWHRDATVFRQLLDFFQQNTLGNPTAKAQREAQKLKSWFNECIPNSEVQVQPLIVFTHPKTTIQIGATTIPIAYTDKRKPSLKAWVREHANLTLTPEQIALVEAKATITE